MNKLDLIDLHTHTCYSDGELTPDELIIKAKNNGVRTLAITDHDTLMGIQNMTLTEKDTGVRVITGIEFSIKVPVGRMHILGYNIDIWNNKLNERLIQLHNRSLYAVCGLICQLKKDFNIGFSTEEILEILNEKRNIGRPDVAKLLVKYNFVPTVQAAFDSYLIPAYEKMGVIAKGITYEECVSLIKEAGGLVVLAHPISLKKTNIELDTYIKELIDIGLDGIEVYHSDHSQENIEKYLEIAEKYNLLISGGSDYHGLNVKPDIEIGHGRNNIKIKQLTLLDKIKN